MISENPLERARELSLRARMARSANDFLAAYFHLSDAIELLEKAVKESNVQPELYYPQLADLYALQGRALQRLDRDDAALRSFEAGRIYANNAKLGTSFYHGQIPLPLWLKSDHSKTDPELLSKVRRAIGTLEEQVMSYGRHDPWMVGDLAIVYLLARRFKDAQSCFSHYRQLAPTDFAISGTRHLLAKIWVHAVAFDEALASVSKEIFISLGGDPKSLVPRDRFSSCFISYSSLDEGFAKRLYTSLQRRGVVCWWAPEDMKTGDRVNSAVDKAISLHDKLVLILSKHSINSYWVEHEVNKALKREASSAALVLFPIRIDNAVLKAEFGWARQLREAHRPTGRHIGDFTRWKESKMYQKAFVRLLRDLKAGADESRPSAR